MPDLADIAFAAGEANATDLAIRPPIAFDTQHELQHRGWRNSNDGRPLPTDMHGRAPIPCRRARTPVSRLRGFTAGALRNRANMIVVLVEESGHVPLEHHRVDETAERTKWRGEVDVIDHSCPVGGLLERVLVTPSAERSSLHPVSECSGSFVRHDLRGHPPSNPEMAGAPGHVLAELHAPLPHTADDALGR